MKNKLRKLIAILLVVMCACTCIIPAFAAGNEQEMSIKTEDFSKSTGLKAQAKYYKETASVFTQNTKNKTQYLLGDATLDGVVNTGDAVMILRYCVDIVQLSALQRNVGDATQNGETNTADATMVLRIAVGLIEQEYIEIGGDGPDITPTNDPAVTPTVTPTDGPVVTPTASPTASPTPAVPTYTVTYADGIDELELSVPITANVPANALYTVAATYPNALGYEFLGWRSSHDNNLYACESTFNMPTANVTLTAEWNKLPGTAVGVNLVDVYNEVTVVETFAMLEESGNVYVADFAIPEGYKAIDQNQTYDIIVGNNGAWPATVQFNIFKYSTETEGEFVLIDNAKGVSNIRLDMTRNYKLTCDIDMGEIGQFRPLGWAEQMDFADTPFTGILDGAGFTLSKLLCDYWSIDTWSYTQNVGLFAVNSGTIKNLNIFTMTYEQSPDTYGIFGYNIVGGIAGINNGLIANCLVQGHVGSSNSDNYEMGISGGIVGVNAAGARVVRCGSNIGAEGFYYIGGVCGQNSGVIEQCWFAGGINSVMEDDMLDYFAVRCVGGICGGNAGNLYDTYAILMSHVKAYDGIGGIAGWARGGFIENFYIAFDSYLYYSNAAQYAGTYLGYIVSGYSPNVTNIYAFNSTSSLPTGFSDAVWDMNGESYRNLPDLIYTRRPEE